MKATPEDVAKKEAAILLAYRFLASMKATPEDVAKTSTRCVMVPCSTRLNEGHARRRGEVR